MRIRKPISPSWPAWFYGLDDEGIFNQIEDVPEGWTRKRGDEASVILPEPTISLDSEELIQELVNRGIEIKPTWSNAHMKRIIDGDVSSTW